MSTQNDNAVSSAVKSAGGAIISNSNVQATISSIRTIAKTKELEQKIEKLIQTERTRALPGLNPVRLVAQQAAMSAGSTASSSSPVRDEQNTPGGIVDNASTTAGDATVQAGGDLFSGGGYISPTDTDSTDKSGSVNIDPSKIGTTYATDAASGIYKISDLFKNKGPYPSERGDLNAPKVNVMIGQVAGAVAWLILRDKTMYDGVPPGWDDADHPPRLPGWEDWELGYWGIADGTYGGTNYGHSVSDAVNTYIETSLTYHSVSFNYDVDDYRNLTNHGTYWTVDFHLTWNTVPINTGWINGYTITIYKVDCGLGDPNEGDNCPTEPPTYTSFPEDGYIQLYWNGHHWTYQHYDTEASAILRTTMSTLVMTDGGDSYTVGPTVQGGWYATFTDAQPGTTPAMLIRPNGTVRDVIDKNLLKYYAVMDKG